MGTPHRGSDVAFWTDFLARALHIAQFGAGTNKNLVSSLKKNSRLLSDISDQFVERSANLQIRTFYEMEKLDYMNILVCWYNYHVIDQYMLSCLSDRGQNFSIPEPF